VLSQKAFSDEVGKTFVPVFLDFPNDKSLVKAATAKRNKELSEKYAIRGFPTVLLLDAKGEVLAQTGYQKGGPEKYLAHVKGLVQNGPLLKKHIKPYEARFEAIGRKFGESAEAVAAKVTGDREAKQKAVKAAFPTFVGPILTDMKALRKDLVAEQVPEAIANDKDGLLKQIDKAVDFLTKASKGELP
jgi:protein-disulfide isomerase-like protein with CxxC motif